MTEQRCENCRFYEYGKCRRFPPARGYYQNMTSDYWQPSVSKDDWCGEWQAKEEA